VSLRLVSGITLTLTTIDTPLPYASRHLGNPQFRDVVTLGLFRSPVRNLNPADSGRYRGITHWRAFYPRDNLPVPGVTSSVLRGDFLTLWLLGFRQFSFDHVSQHLQILLGMSGFPQFALHRCYVHTRLSVCANCVVLVGILVIDLLSLRENHNARDWAH
jgi:hypothetical protein